MVYRVVGLIWALVAGLWLWEHGWSHAGQIAAGVVLALGMVLVHAFWPLFFAWLVWPTRKQRLQRR
ncbi:MAG: hypothetical protein IAE92_02475 [Burkholderiaceae bacterium]|nr:hypothetical protein [Burkholderiaceae bacterium]